MFDVAIWGTVASWTGSLLTGLSVLFGVGYYVFDRRRERRAQAGSVVVWLHPHEQGPPFIKMLNLSDKPVFDYGCAIASKSKRQIAKKPSCPRPSPWRSAWWPSSRPQCSTPRAGAPHWGRCPTGWPRSGHRHVGAFVVA